MLTRKPNEKRVAKKMIKRGATTVSKLENSPKTPKSVGGSESRMVKASPNVAPNKMPRKSVTSLGKSVNKDDFQKFLKYSEGEDRSSLKNTQKLINLSTKARVSSAESKYKR
jgi:capsid protein